MMLHKKSSRASLLKLLALIPIVSVALVVNAETVTDVVYTQPQKQQPVKKGKKAGTIKVGSQEIKVEEATDTKAGQTTGDAIGQASEEDVVEYTATVAYDKVFDVVEETPQFPGGPAALMAYIAKSLRYSKEAEQKGIQGRVIATFVVETDGSITTPRVVKPVDPTLDAEVLRIVQEMPKWEPGKQGGQPVRVKYTITFRLDNGPAIQSSSEEDPNTIGEAVVMGHQEKVAKPDEHTLFVVDGDTVEYESLKDIDPKTIDHIDVLKDKSAIKHYGEKGKHGVVLITTKKQK